MAESTLSPSGPTMLFLCTGNAARSVMAAAMMRDRHDGVVVTSAGTHSIPGLPMSTRTRAALAGHEVVDHDHRSAQLDQEMVDDADVVIVFELMHVSYMRKKHPSGAAKVVSLPRLARELEPGDIATFADRVGALDLATREFEPWEEVVDPAGGDLEVFEAAADVINRLINDLAPKIGTAVHAGS